MNRTTRWVAGIGILAGAGYLTNVPASAGPPMKECSLETLKGQYISAATGTIYPPLFGVTQPSQFTVALYSVYYGNGTGVDYASITIGGGADVAPHTQPATYTLNSDCTGTKPLEPDGPTFDIRVAYDGSSFAIITTTPGLAISGIVTRVRGNPFEP
jgi:hypothetical protein